MQRFITVIIEFFQRPYFITSHIFNKHFRRSIFSQESVAINIEIITHKATFKGDKS